MLTGLVRLLTILGGVALLAMVAVTCLSVLGRSASGALHAVDAVWADALLNFGVGPINGDFELVEVGMAFAIFAFLPLCTLRDGHAKVEIFERRLPKWLKRLLRVCVEAAFVVVFCLMAVQLFQGMVSKQRSGQTSFLLEFPIWWGYLLALFGAVTTAAVAIYRLFTMQATGSPPDKTPGNRESSID